MRIYLAAPWSERDYARRVMLVCEMIGIEVTSRWLKEPSENNDEWARYDLDDVRAADWFVALNPPGYENSGTGGRHVELGYALALGKSIMLVGERSNIFHCLSSITVLDDGTPESIAVALAARRDAE